MTLDSWLEAHPYLRPLAELSAEVDRAAAEIEIPEAPVPDWDDYRSDFLAGVTLLQSADAAVDLDPGGRTAAALIERLALAGSSGWLAAETRPLHGRRTERAWLERSRPGAEERQASGSTISKRTRRRSLLPTTQGG